MNANELAVYTIKALNLAGHYVWRQNNRPIKGRTFTGKKGLTDVIGISKNGKMLCIEIKVGKDKLRKEQIEFHSQIVKHGGVAVVVSTASDVDFMVEHGEAQIDLTYVRL